MKKVLIITAHPSSKNLTKAMADIYQEEKEKKGHSVKRVDLYKDKQLPFLSFEDAHTPWETETVRDYQEMIKEADEIVFVYPFWWGSMPAILKNWIDSVFTMGFAAKYGENGRPIGLLGGRSVRILSTSGAPTFWYCINGVRWANRLLWKSTIVNFCGMKFEGYHLFGGVDTSGKNIQKIFDKVKKIANQQ